MNNLIKGITTSEDLIKLAKHIGVKLDGIVDIKDLREPINQKGSFIILLNDGQSVGHWVAVYNGKYFDSMGIPPPMILGLKYFSKRQYQSTYTDYCGIWCLLWLYCKQNNKMDILNQFVNLSARY